MSNRFLIVVADDYGIGPETSRAILELAEQNRITATVLMVNSPFAEVAVGDWERSGRPMELGWHPVLTMDPPVLPASLVPSLVRRDGCFYSLGKFIQRAFLKRLRPSEIEAELLAQYQRFIDMVGHPPSVVNSHQHTQIFEPVGQILLKILGRQKPLPYVRRIREPWSMLRQIPGARVKRAFLSAHGRKLSDLRDHHQFPGNDWLAGTTDPPFVKDPEFFRRWLTRVPGRVIELACHPGYLDRTIVGRDCTEHDGLLQRRVDEMHLLSQPDFLNVCREAGFKLIAPTDLIRESRRGSSYAA